MPKSSNPSRLPITDKNLKDLISKTLKRQHLASSVPPALRFIPLGALAAADLLEQRFGKNVMEGLFIGKKEEVAVLTLGRPESAESGMEGRILSCGVCRSFHTPRTSTYMDETLCPISFLSYTSHLSPQRGSTMLFGAQRNPLVSVTR